MSSFNTLGVAFDNLTTVQRDALVLPEKAMVIYHLDETRLEINQGTPGAPIWVPIYGEVAIQVNVPGLGGVVVPEVSQDNFMFGQVEFFLYTKTVPTQILTPEAQAGVGAPGSPIGNLGANITNNNFGDLCYNNFGAASGTNLPYYTFDMGAPTADIDRLRIWWWQFNNYVPNNFRIEANNTWNPDPLDPTWTTIVGGLAGTNILGNIQDVIINNVTPYRYWRIFVENGFNLGNTFIVCNEMEFQQAQTIYRSIEDYDNVTFFFDGNGELNVQNLDAVDTTLTVRYRI